MCVIEQKYNPNINKCSLNSIINSPKEYKKTDPYYCRLAEKLADEFSDDIVYIDYYVNVLDEEYLTSMFDILKSNLSGISPISFSEENKKIWINNLSKSSNESLITLAKHKGKIIGYIQYNKDGFLAEIQIDKKYQSKFNVFKNLIRRMINNLNTEVEIIRLRVSKNNIKSDQIFRHVGFVKSEKGEYEISKKDLLNYIQ